MKKELEIMSKVCEQKGIAVAGQAGEGATYINLNDLTDWLVERFGTSTGAVNAAVFEIFEQLQRMEKFVERSGHDG